MSETTTPGPADTGGPGDRRRDYRQQMESWLPTVKVTAAAFVLARVIAGLLYGVEARDPGVFVAIPILLSLVALAAVWLPARRASLVAPVIALRTE